MKGILYEGNYFINTTYDKQYGSVSPDYLACIIGLLSMLSLIMNKHDMSNNPTHYVIDVLQQVVFTIVLELIRSGTYMSFRIRPNIRAALLRTKHHIMQMRIKQLGLDGIEFIVMHVIISSAPINELTNSLIFISIVQYSDYLIESGKDKALGKDMSILFLCV